MAKMILNGIEYAGIEINDTQPVGEIIDSGSDTAPLGYLPCDGRSLLRSEYPELFKAIGTKYGAVDAQHFNLPNESKASDIIYTETTEHPTNELFMGKQVYRKLVTFTKPVSTAGTNYLQYITTDIPKSCTVIRTEGFCVNGTGYNFRLSGDWSSNGSGITDWSFSHYINTADPTVRIMLRYGSAFASAVYTVYVMLDYIKE